MKKFLAAGMLAICLIATSQQQASAWIKTGFGIGFNWGWSSGGNSIACGAWHNGQLPAQQGYYGGHYHQHQSYHGHQHGYAMPAYPAIPQYSGSFDMPSFEPAYAPYLYASQPGQVYYQPAPYFYVR